MKAVCISLGEGVPNPQAWLTLHREYLVLAVLAIPGRSIKFRVLSDDGRTPILADSSMFAAFDQPLPGSWVCAVTQDGVVEFAPKEWLEPGFWERFFDRDELALEVFRREIDAMGGQAL